MSLNKAVDAGITGSKAAGLTYLILGHWPWQIFRSNCDVLSYIISPVIYQYHSICMNEYAVDIPTAFMQKYPRFCQAVLGFT